MGSELEWFGRTLSSRLRFLELFILADLHRGNPYSDRNLWLRSVDYIHQKREAYAILGGDLCESVVLGSKGDIFNQKLTPHGQMDSIIEELLPIKHKILGATGGNHEQRIYERVGFDITELIAKQLGCPYDPDGIFLKVMFGNNCARVPGQRFSYWVYVSHGYGGARTRSAKAIKAERLASYIVADVVAMAHDHDANIAPYEVLEPDPRSHNGNGGFIKGKVRAHRTLLVKASAYLKWGGYSRSKGYAPSTLISPAVLLGGETKPWPMPSEKLKNVPEVRGIL